MRTFRIYRKGAIGPELIFETLGALTAATWFKGRTARTDDQGFLVASIEGGHLVEATSPEGETLVMMASDSPLCPIRVTVRNVTEGLQ